MSHCSNIRPPAVTLSKRETHILHLLQLHLVHSQAAEPGKPASGKLAVIGVFFDVTRGDSNVGIQKITQVRLRGDCLSLSCILSENRLSNGKEIFQLINGMKTHAAADLDGLAPAMLLPSDREFFTYEGSLTTPPCSEVVQWFVLREPLKINEREVRRFQVPRSNTEFFQIKICIRSSVFATLMINEP